MRSEHKIPDFEISILCLVQTTILLALKLEDHQRQTDVPEFPSLTPFPKPNL